MQKRPAADTAHRPAAARWLPPALGWFSIGLGLAELVAPHAVARLCGTRSSPALIRMYGLREIAAGVGILASRNAAPWLWSRVAGDALDLTTLALGSDKRHPQAMARSGAAMLSVAAIGAADVYAAQQYRQAPATPGVDFPDYSDRRGFPRPPDEMRGAARRDFEIPADMRTPEALRPWTFGATTHAAGAPA